MSNKSKNPANKNSVIRVLASNYSQTELKEIKVLYAKQGGVDTIHIEDMETDKDSSKVRFKSATCTSSRVEILPKEDGSLHITKYYVMGEQKRKTQEYTIWGTYKKTNAGKTRVRVGIRDLMDHGDEQAYKRRRKESHTERDLITEETAKNYAAILKCKPSQVDSLSIYKAKRFFSYRSDLLFYYAFIDDFLVRGVNEDIIKKEIWRLVDHNRKRVDAEKEGEIKKAKKYDKKWNDGVDQLTKHISGHIETFINNHKNYVDRMKRKKELNKKRRDDVSPIDKPSNEELREDIVNILFILSDLRHKLGHYTFDHFYDLFGGKEVTVKTIRGAKEEQEPLSQLLDLHIFKALDQAVAVKESHATTFLEDKTQYRLLGHLKTAKKAYNRYRMICNRKNGFNRFINSFFTTDGVENQSVKEIVNRLNRKQIEYLEAEIAKGEKKDIGRLRTELEERRYLLDMLGEAYCQDIHLSDRYKSMYKKHKDLSDVQTALIERYDRKKSVREEEHRRIREQIHDNNKKLAACKREMELLTKRNAKYRLQTKLQLAYGFLFSEFNGDYYSFMQDFYPSKPEILSPYYEKVEQYLTWYVEPKVFKLNEVDKWAEHQPVYTGGILSTKPDNNLVKLYILLYILLPVEVRGDFLGQVKSHYYDFKNVEDFGDLASDPSGFFHNLRLFEKNSKKYSFISYSIESFRGAKKAYGPTLERLNIVGRLNNTKEQDTGDFFTRAFLTPLILFYRNAFQLANDVELHALLQIARKKADIKTIDEVIYDITEKKKYFKFSELLEASFGVMNISEDPEYDASAIRNKVMHMNHDELFEEPFTVYENPKEKKTERSKQSKRKKTTLHEDVRALDKAVKELELDQLETGYDFINDFYMRLDRQLFRLRKLRTEEPEDTKKQERDRNRKYLFARHGLSGRSSHEILKRANELNDLVQKGLPFTRAVIERISDIEVRVPKLKGKTKRIGKMSNKERNNIKENIQFAIQHEISDLIGAYRQMVLTDIRQEMIQLLTHDETRYMNVVYYNKATKERKRQRFDLPSEGECDIKKFLPKGKIVVYSEGASKKVELRVDGEPVKVKINGKYVDKLDYNRTYIHSVDYAG